MKYFKNTELAKLYNISEKSVRNWIESTRQGKLDLQLFNSGGRDYIANTSQNVNAIERLADKGRKYKNTRGHKTVKPAPTFYELFDSKAIFDIVSNLDIHREIPLQYSYFDGGAELWDYYVKRLADESAPNIFTNTQGLIAKSAPYIDELFEEDEKINIIDIGPGNGYPVRNMLQRYLDNGRLNRYICIDISPHMLKIAEKNIKEWFDGKVKFESYVRDITYERFNDLLAPDSFGKDSSVRNIVLMLGSTLSNFREPGQPLSIVKNSMGKNDLFVFAKQLDTIKARRYFDYYTDPSQASVLVLPPKSKFTVELLNITPEFYDVETFFDEKSMARYIQIKLKIALSLEFNLDNKPRTINLNKGERILLGRNIHLNIFDTFGQFDRAGLVTIESMTSKDGECLFSISKVKAADVL